MKQTVTSKYEPKSKNVTWIDMSTGSPVQKNFINGMWRPTGGGGGAGSSNPTEADATKVWQVTPVLKENKTEETVIVPEQTLADKDILEYNDKFVPGAQCVAVVNGIEYRREVVELKGSYIFEAEFGAFCYDHINESFVFYNTTELSEVTAKLSVIEEVPAYDYNWIPGVKIPVPTAEDKGKILVVNKVEGDSKEYELVPTQTVTFTDEAVVLQNISNLDKFVEGATITSVIDGTTYIGQVVNGKNLYVTLQDESMYWSLDLVENGGEVALTLISSHPGTYEISASVLEKEYSYEYQLQQNSGGSSNVLWPALYKNEFGNEIMATLVPEDVKPGTWCMVCGTNSYSRPVCYPALINEYGDYTLYSGISDIAISVSIPFGGVGGLLTISSNAV